MAAVGRRLKVLQIGHPLAPRCLGPAPQGFERPRRLGLLAGVEDQRDVVKAARLDVEPHSHDVASLTVGSDLGALQAEHKRVGVADAGSPALLAPAEV